MEDRFEELIREADTEYFRGNYLEAMELFGASYALVPDARSLRGLGECYLGLQRPRDAIVYLAASAGMRPNPRVSYDLAIALLKSGFLDEARRAVDRALAALPHFKKATALRDEICSLLGED